jgi:DmsE family decaheme c-type cytochrome
MLYDGSPKIALAVRRGCEGCHGPGENHDRSRPGAIIDPRTLGKRQIESLCLSCHEMQRLTGDPKIHFPGHAPGHVGCLNCHRAHRAATPGSLRDEPVRMCLACHSGIKAQLAARSRHPVRPEGLSPLFSNREGKVSCTDCHRPDSPRGDPLGSGPGKETCQGCHPETQGPFLFEHDAGSAELSGGCLACHLPHGSPHRRLLRASGRSLCLSCHSDFGSGHFPGASCTTSGCHLDIHGSNRNQFFLR